MARPVPRRAGRNTRRESRAEGKRPVKVERRQSIRWRNLADSVPVGTKAPGGGFVRFQEGSIQKRVQSNNRQDTLQLFSSAQCEIPRSHSLTTSDFSRSNYEKIALAIVSFSDAWGAKLLTSHLS